MSNTSKELRQRLAELRKHLRQENRRWPAHLVEVLRCDWPLEDFGRVGSRDRVLRSAGFLVQESLQANGYVLLGVNRTWLGDDGRFEAGITWDELMELKRQAGYADRDALEVYPRERDVVNVANMRWLWLPPEPVSFAWRARR